MYKSLWPVPPVYDLSSFHKDENHATLYQRGKYVDEDEITPQQWKELTVERWGYHLMNNSPVDLHLNDDFTARFQAATPKKRKLELTDLVKKQVRNIFFN